MRIYRSDTKEKVVKVVCNKCGRELTAVNGTVMEGVCTVEIDWGYFSEKDGEHHSFDLCEKCYDGWVKGFSIPIDVKEKTELLS